MAAPKDLHAAYLASRKRAEKEMLKMGGKAIPELRKRGVSENKIQKALAENKRKPS